MATTTPTEIPAPNQRTAARIAGYSYIALFVFAVFANFAVVERLVDPDDAAATFQDLAESETMLRLAIGAFLLIFVLDVLVAWALYHLFRPVGAAISSLTAWFRIVYTVFLGVALVFLFAVLQLVGDADHITAFDQTARDTHSMLALDAFNATWLIGLTCFGVHLALLGFMIVRSSIASRILGVLLLVAGGAYVFDTLAYTLLSSYTDNETVFSTIVVLPAVLGEAAFMIWLLTRAGRRDDAPVEDRDRSLAAV